MSSSSSSTPSPEPQQQQHVVPSLSIYQSIMSHTPKSPLSSSAYNAMSALHHPVQLYGESSPTATPADLDPTSPRFPTLGALTMHALPYPQAWSTASAAPQQLPPNFDWVSESCGAKAAIGVIGGGAMGLVMGVFMGALTDMTPPVTIIDGKEVPQAPLKEQMRTTLRATAEKSMYWCRQFAFITGVFGGSECLVEKYRGKHDVWNQVISGCVTGAAMQAKSGPQASAMGCGGFAAFSLVIDTVMGNY